MVGATRTEVRLEDRMTGGGSRVGDGAVEYVVQKSLFEEVSVGRNLAGNLTLRHW